MSTEEPTIQIQVNTVGPWEIPEALLERGCRSLLEEEGVQEGEVSITLLEDGGIAELNREYFEKDQPTDVIAFTLHEGDEPLLGDVYLGYEEACRQASELGVPLEEELLRLSIHGVLHVLGYRHPQGEERFESPMFRRQEEHLKRVLALDGS